MIVEYLKKLPFYEKHWFQFILFVLRRFEADRCREQAGSLTYTTLFAVVPMLTVFGYYLFNQSIGTGKTTAPTADI